MHLISPRGTLTPLRAAALLAAMSVGGLVLGQSLSPQSRLSAATGTLSTSQVSGGATTSTHTSPVQTVVATHVPFRAPVVVLASPLSLASVARQGANSEVGTPPGHGAHHDHQTANGNGNGNGHGHGHGGHGGHGN